MFLCDEQYYSSFVVGEPCYLERYFTQSQVLFLLVILFMVTIHAFFSVFRPIVMDSGYLVVTTITGACITFLSKDVYFSWPYYMLLATIPIAASSGSLSGYFHKIYTAFMAKFFFQKQVFTIKYAYAMRGIRDPFDFHPLLDHRLTFITSLKIKSYYGQF